jgi:hypothetical protein
MSLRGLREGTATDYGGKLYSGVLEGRVMRGYMQISMSCCPAFGTRSCLDCPLEEFIPHCVPGCGMSKCEKCAMRSGCPCGNEELRKTLLEEIGAELTLVGR